MKGTLCTCSVLLVASAVLAHASTEDLIRQGDELWLERSESLEHVNKAIELWERAAHADPSDEHPAYRISMAYYYLGRFTDDAQKKMDLFLKGKEWGLDAIRRNPNRPDAHYWYAVNLGNYGQVRGKLKSLFLLKPMKDALNEVLHIDPQCYYGGAYRVLGKMYFELPGFAGGDKHKAEEYLRKSLEIDPCYTLTLLYLAQVLIDLHRKEEAKQVLGTLMKCSPSRGFEREYRDDQAEAKKLLDTLK